MSSESPQRLASAPEVLQKEVFKERLQAILTSQLTVENIDSFADTAYNNLVAVTADVVKQYATQFPKESAQYSNPSKEIEDAAFKAFDLGEVGEMLDNIQAVKEKIDSLKLYINTEVLNTETVIIPPQEDMEVKRSEEGTDENTQEKKLVPRLLTLLYILKHDFDLTSEDLSITKGSVHPEMWREEPYYRVDVPSLERQVYICDEEGNASYIFDSIKLQELGTSLEELDASDKGEKNALIAQHPGLGVRIIQTPSWRQYVSQALIDIKTKEITQMLSPVSEFTKKERHVFLQFDDFQTEVRALYPDHGEGNVQRWYKNERKIHLNWPSHPDGHYKSTGWEGWSELVGTENKFKKEFPTFDEFKTEVRALYPGDGDVTKWYHEEKERHPKWPSSPSKHYKSRGWIGWPELAGIANRTKKELPIFDKFQAEVQAFYPGKGLLAPGVEDWYSREYKQHPNWPSVPSRHYKSTGWEGFQKLVGKEWLTFDEFKTEVRALYPGSGNIRRWYQEERKQHSNWPSNPNRIYRSKGWTGWRNLVKGKE